MTTTATEGSSLELDDIQGGAIHQRPSLRRDLPPVLRIDDRQAGQDPAAAAGGPLRPSSSGPAQNAWVTVRRVLRVRRRCEQPLLVRRCAGMAVNSGQFGRWSGEQPRTGKSHGVAQGGPRRAGGPVTDAAVGGGEPRARTPGHRGSLRGEGSRTSCYRRFRPVAKSFGFEGRANRPSRGAGSRHPIPLERAPMKAGGILGYPDETGELPPMPTPSVLGRNGAYVVFRKLHTHVAAYDVSPRPGGGLAGRGRSWRQDGRPLAERSPWLSSTDRGPELGGDGTRNNAFLYGDDRRGLKCPACARWRANPRDAFDGDGSVDVRLHRMIRRGQLRLNRPGRRARG